MNGTCYLVERFDDALNSYQVEDIVSKEDYKEINKEIIIYGRSGKIKSVQGSTNFIDMLNKSSGVLERGKPSVDSSKTRHGIQNSPVQRMGEIPIDRREPTPSNGRGDSQGGGKNIQKYSRELDTDYMTAVEQGDMKTAQKMVDEAAKILAHTQTHAVRPYGVVKNGTINWDLAGR
jgi:hypothetical protein